MNEIVMVPLDDLVPDLFGLRVAYDEAVVSELAGSIDLHGIRVPLLVRPFKGKFQIVDGNYRFHAAKYRGLGTVPCLVEELSDGAALEVAAVANWHRTDFSFLDRANTVRKFREAGVSDEGICIKLGIAPRTLYHYSSFIENVQINVEEILSPRGKERARIRGHHEEAAFPLVEKVTARHAEALVLLKENPNLQVELANRIVAESLSGPKAILEAKRILQPSKPPALKTVPLRLTTDLYEKLKAVAPDRKLGLLVIEIVEEWLEARKNG